MFLFPLILKTLVHLIHVVKGAPVCPVENKTLFACAWLVIPIITPPKLVRLVSTVVVFVCVFDLKTQ